VAGRVEARSVLVYGRIEGDLAATEKAEVAASGSTEGDIEAPRVVIAEGAYFKGNVKMGQPSSAGRQRPAAGPAGPPAREGAP
jgi:cytoskeletal protein CcmA (bactofilin family)